MHFCQFELCAGQAPFGRGQEPSHRLRPAAFDGVAAIVQSVFVDDAEIELRLGIAAFGGLKQMFHHTRHSWRPGVCAAVNEQRISCFLRKDAALSAPSTRLED
jgi:hypothetical protein